MPPLCKGGEGPKAQGGLPRHSFVPPPHGPLVQRGEGPKAQGGLSRYSFVPRTLNRNPSTANAVPLPLTREALRCPSHLRTSAQGRLCVVTFPDVPLHKGGFGLPRTWGTLHAPASTLPCRTAGTTRRGGHPTDPAARSAAGPRETAAHAAHPNQFAPSNPHHPPHFSLLTRPLYPEKGPSSRYFRSFVRYSDTRTNVSSPFGSVVSSLRQNAKSAWPTANSFCR